MASLFSVLLAAARFLTQHARSALKLRTVERFSRAIWSIIFISCLLGTLRFFEHDTTTYTFCIDTEPAVTWAQRCMVRDGPLIAFLGLGRPFWKAFLPLADLFVQFIIPATLLVLLHIGFNRDPIINTGADKHNRFGRSMRDQTRIVIYAITVSFLVVQLPTTCVTLLSLTATHFAAIHTFAVIALLIGHLQPLFAVASILANSGGLLAAYYVIVKDDDLDVDHDSNSSMEDGDAENYLLQRGRGRHGTYRGSNYLSTSMSFDTSSMRTYSRRGSDYPVEHVFLVNTPQTSPVQQMNQQIPQQLSPIPFQEYQRKGSQQRKGSGQRKESQQRRTSSPSQRRQSAGTSSSKRSSPSPVPPSFLVGFSSKC